MSCFGSAVDSLEPSELVTRDAGAVSLFDHPMLYWYPHRPSELSALCLYQFSISWTPTRSCLPDATEFIDDRGKRQWFQEVDIPENCVVNCFLPKSIIDPGDLDLSLSVLFRPWRNIENVPHWSQLNIIDKSDILKRVSEYYPYHPSLFQSEIQRLILEDDVDINGEDCHADAMGENDGLDAEQIQGLRSPRVLTDAEISENSASISSEEQIVYNQENQGVSSFDLEPTFRLFTAEQWSILAFLQSSFFSDEQFFWIIQGEGGTGKSYVISSMIKLIAHQYGSHEYAKVCAYTGTAANNVNGSTIHSLIGFGFDNKRLCGSLPVLQEKLKFLRYLIVDEMSFLSKSVSQIVYILVRHDFPIKNRSPASKNKG